MQVARIIAFEAVVDDHRRCRAGMLFKCLNAMSKRLNSEAIEYLLVGFVDQGREIIVHC